MTILKFWLAVSRNCIIMLDLLPVISAQIHHRTHLTVTPIAILHKVQKGMVRYNMTLYTL